MDKVVRFEIPADDLARARKFYTSVFGWKMESVTEMEYINQGKNTGCRHGLCCLFQRY